ncbi:hypothetical protein [Bosea sp. BIWAKO-01]|uniref:hypothetical protein n=1 Tax=Bosea sp. BIWAKO-01 TaxID=506668 RepID=UPI0008533427|nr:hypothetical protein [Bosea sp. BIWAKO-01]GAU82925.1 hypothetical protein BIWAKO_02848 [Bosea sp. BIWAKO-01]
MPDHSDYLAPACITNPPNFWWRLLGPEDWSEFSLEGLYDRVLNPLEFINEPRWVEARRGDASAAVALALKYDRAGVPEALIDAMMSAIIVASLMGNRAARLVLIRALARRRRADPSCDHALHAWSELDHELVMDGRARKAARAAPHVYSPSVADHRDATS